MSVLKFHYKLKKKNYYHSLVLKPWIIIVRELFPQCLLVCWTFETPGNPLSRNVLRLDLISTGCRSHSSAQFLIGDQEPWAFRGGLAGEFQVSI